MMYQTDPAVHKIFLIDYKYLYGYGDNRMRTYLTMSTSRKNAEHSAREYERHNKINIFKITPVLFTSDVEDMIDEAIASHVEYCQEHMPEETKVVFNFIHHG
jgi:hypothetical protein